MGDIWETCLKYKVREFGWDAEVVASSCQIPEPREGQSGGVRVLGTAGGVWGLVVVLVVGVGLVEGVVV